MQRFGGHTFAGSLKAAALLFGCFIAGVIGFGALRDYAETFPPKTFLWTWLFWASIVVLLLANVAMMFAMERFRRAVRLLWSRRAAATTHKAHQG
jgi:hypothetical protein